MIYIGVFIVLFAIIFATFFLPKSILSYQFMKKEEYFQLFFASLLIIFFFGYFQMLISKNPSYLYVSFGIASFFLIWYFITKTILHMIHRDFNIL